MSLKQPRMILRTPKFHILLFKNSARCREGPPMPATGLVFVIRGSGVQIPQPAPLKSIDYAKKQLLTPSSSTHKRTLQMPLRGSPIEQVARLEAQPAPFASFPACTHE
ncbi:MAG: hypothetical protein AB7S74_07415, partial [Hyphomicrobium sp.]